MGDLNATGDTFILKNLLKIFLIKYKPSISPFYLCRNHHHV